MEKMKVYRALWCVMTVAYAVWMLAFMRFDTYTTANTLLEKEMYPSAAVYYLWVVLSTGLFLLFPLFIKKI